MYDKESSLGCILMEIANDGLVSGDDLLLRIGSERYEHRVFWNISCIMNDIVCDCNIG